MDNQPKTFREILKKPSAAVRAMVDGLREIPGETFRVRMESFGYSIGGVCYGCAATCAVQQATGKRFLPDQIGKLTVTSIMLDIEVMDMGRFEWVIDSLRKGQFVHLANYFGVPHESLCRCALDRDALPELTNDNYLERLPAYEAFADRLEAAGY